MNLVSGTWQGRRALLWLACGLLAACAGPGANRPPAPAAPLPAPAKPPSSPVVVPAAKPLPTPGNTTAHGGGYYKDDGPGENPPADLESIPDAQPRTEPLHRFANRPYAALGLSFTPRTELAPYTVQGRASWYGKRFHGRRTASGEPYDMYAMTAAHPTLPIPSYARVTSLENGRSVVVRINDRGPFHKDRVMDLSFAAAWRLGYTKAGSAMVQVEAIVPEEMGLAAAPVPAAAPAAPPVLANELLAANGPLPAVASSEVLSSLAPGIYLQLGAFGSARNAADFRSYLQTELSFLDRPLLMLQEGDKTRLYAGTYPSLEVARRMAERIAQRIKIKPFPVTRQ